MEGGFSDWGNKAEERACFVGLTGNSDLVPEIRFAETPQEFEAFGRLINEYVDWCKRRYVNDQWFVIEAFDHQSLEKELDNLSDIYGPPRGRTLLATTNGEIQGVGAYRRLSAEICEMKRLYVPDRYRGSGIGKQLCTAIMASARTDGYRLMRLDTGRLLTEAVKLYESLGFRECPPYQSYPEKLMPHLLFLECNLA